MQATEISAEEKRQALQDLLSSVALRRADQLRQFLRFIVEEEIAGSGAQIREWDIAVRALNRPPSYTPETDSTVRTRAHSLRQRLAEYYAVEAPHAEIRIELPKGGYTPRFVRVHDAGPSADLAASDAIERPEFAVTMPVVHPLSVQQRYHPWLWAAAGLLVGLALCAAVVVFPPARKSLGLRFAREISAEIAEVWGPVLNGNSTVRIVMSSPFQLWVRDYRSYPTPLVDPAESPPMPDDPKLLRSYAEHARLYPDSRLYLHGNSAGALWGDAAGVQIATRFLSERNVKCELVPERSLNSGYVLRNDSYLAFGRSEYSPLMAGKIPQNGLDVQYLPSIRRHGIAPRSGASGGPTFLPTPGTPSVNYGLITILRDTADDGHTRQAMFFAGAISNGAQAAIEFMTSPRHLKLLIEKLRASGIKRWPRAMQIVVRSETSEFYPLRTEYESHVVLKL